MKERELSTEEQIKKAATKVFLEKGFDGATTRDIAQEAGLNIALLNYYFRSKVKLFAIVYEDLLRDYFQTIITILDQSIGLKEKLSIVIDCFFNKFRESRRLSAFINYEMRRNPDQLLKVIDLRKILKNTMFESQLQEAISKGEVRPIDAGHLFFLLMANVQFLFENDVLNKEVLQLDEEAYTRFATNHKTLVKEIINGYLYKES